MIGLRFRLIDLSPTVSAKGKMTIMKAAIETQSARMS